MPKQLLQEEILSVLVKDGILNEKSADDIRKKAAKAKKSIEDELFAGQLVDYERLTMAKAKAYNLKYKDLYEKKIDDASIHTIFPEVAKNYKAICFERKANKIKIGLVDPLNLKAMEAIEFMAKKNGWEAEYYLISEASFGSAMKFYQTLNKEVISALKNKAEEDGGEMEFKSQKSVLELEEATKSAPVARIVSVIIRHAIDGGASDIHIEPMQKETRVRYRIDGILHNSLTLPKNVHAAVVARIKVLAGLKLDETRVPQDGRIHVNMNSRLIDLRVSILPLLDDEKVVMRILDISRTAPDIKDLGFIGPSLRVVEKNIKKTDGLFLITGPTGSGKSTTLFSMLNIINKEDVNISTLEDPIEYFVEGANQSQVKPEIGYTFATGLRSLLRQDPNVIMVGEIRDIETAELAIHAGLTGHSVLSTLHTNDAVGAISRLINMGVEAFLLSSTLNTIVAQRLVRKICVNCKVKIAMPKEIEDMVREELNNAPKEYLDEMLPGLDLDKLEFHKGKGCQKCGNSGYSGRMTMDEAIDINDGMKEVIAKKHKSVKLEDVKATQEFITIRQDGITKVLKGETTIEEFLRIVHT